MALFQHMCLPSPWFSKGLPKNDFHQNSRFPCYAIAQISQNEERLATHYQPSIWSYELMKTVKNGYGSEKYKKRARRLEFKVRMMLDDEGASVIATLDLIHSLQRLGLGYRFEKEIVRTLAKINSKEELEENLHATALRFRLLRQHGFEVSEDVFKSCIDHNGGSLACLQKDVQGLLSLYEASFLGYDEDTLLDEAKSYAKVHLKYLKNYTGTSMREKVYHALELPLHHGMQRLEARWYIDACIKKKDANHLLLELAILDFNMVQAAHQKDLQHVSRWWKSLGLASNLSFIRDRLMECFFWTVGVASEPHFSTCRIGLTKVTALITTIDDVYDVYGSLDELQLFTEAIESWDIDAVERLPDYMKFCFLALYNTVNEMAYDALKEQGVYSLPILTNMWKDMCQAFLVEAKWNHNKYTPTLDDYLDNAWRSVSGVVILGHAYFLTSRNVTQEEMDCLQNYHDLLKWSSMIFRLCNDLGTSTAEIERGETANSIRCYMTETGFSEELAREHIKSLVDEAWKKMNKYIVDDSPFPKTFIERAINLARIAQC
ncbi:hypothetical protein RJ639_014749, partial [Escallonia herrerae]